MECRAYIFNFLGTGGKITFNEIYEDSIQDTDYESFDINGICICEIERTCDKIVEDDCLKSSNVIVTNINGCQESDVGKGGIFPDLSIIAKNFYNFINSNASTRVALRKNLKHFFKNGYAGSFIPEEYVTISRNIPIILTGFSRGAVTCFAIAKYLKSKGVRNPIYIYAIEPVPGNSYAYSNSILRKYISLNECDNIKSCYLMLGSYNKDRNNFIVNSFFKQMIPTLNNNTHTQIYMMPISDHWHRLSNNITACYWRIFLLELTKYSVNITNLEYNDRIRQRLIENAERYIVDNKEHFQYTNTKNAQNIFLNKGYDINYIGKSLITSSTKPLLKCSIIKSTPTPMIISNNSCAIDSCNNKHNKKYCTMCFQGYFCNVHINKDKVCPTCCQLKSEDIAFISSLRKLISNIENGLSIVYSKFTSNRKGKIIAQYKEVLKNKKNYIYVSEHAEMVHVILQMLFLVRGKDSMHDSNGKLRMTSSAKYMVEKINTPDIILNKFTSYDNENTKKIAKILENIKEIQHDKKGTTIRKKYEKILGLLYVQEDFSDLCTEDRKNFYYTIAQNRLITLI